MWVFAVWALQQKPALLTEGDVAEGGVIERDMSGAAGNGAQMPKKYKRSALSEARLDQIADKIKNCMDEEKLYQDADLSLNELSTHLGISTNYLSQAINTIFKDKFYGYINRIRVQYAAGSLKNTNNPVVDIAINSGFNSRSSFYRTFIKQFHCTPTEYRKYSFPL